jgi:AcrR family transcriptional regulator
MLSDDLQPKLSRRGQAIRHGADLLHEGGPSALTSVAVAARMGITQSAVYRHVSDMDELSALAAEVVVSEMMVVVNTILLDPTIDWDQSDDIGHMCRSLIDSLGDNGRSFAVIDQWRFVDGPLGEGIRKVIAEGSELIATVLELRWRGDFGSEAKLPAKARSALARHASALQDDALAVARLARTNAHAFTPDELASMLHYRLLAGWSAFAIDINDLMGLEFPVIDLSRAVALADAR